MKGMFSFGFISQSTTVATKNAILTLNNGVSLESKEIARDTK